MNIFYYLHVTDCCPLPLPYLISCECRRASEFVFINFNTEPHVTNLDPSAETGDNRSLAIIVTKHMVKTGPNTDQLRSEIILAAILVGIGLQVSNENELTKDDEMESR